MTVQTTGYICGWCRRPVRHVSGKVWVHVETGQSNCPDREHNCSDWQHFVGYKGG
jgi:hypothetical protein